MSSDNIPTEITISVTRVYSRLFGCRNCISIGSCDFCSIYDAEAGTGSWWRLCKEASITHFSVEAEGDQIKLTGYDLRQMRDHPEIPFYVNYHVDSVIIPIYFTFVNTLNASGKQRCIGIELAQGQEYQLNWFVKYLKY